MVNKVRKSSRTIQDTYYSCLLPDTGAIGGCRRLKDMVLYISSVSRCKLDVIVSTLACRKLYMVADLSAFCYEAELSQERAFVCGTAGKVVA